MIRLDRITMQGFKSFAHRVTVPFPSGFNCVCGPNGSGKSCRGDTQVLLSTGEFRPIKELVEGALDKSRLHVKLDDGVFTYENPDKLQVLGLDTESMKVVEKDISAFVKRQGEKELYKIVTRTGRNVVTTGCHPVMVFRDGKIVSEVVENLNGGDFIATPRKLDLPENELNIDGVKIDEDFARFIGYLIGDGYITSNRIELINSEETILNDFEYLANKFGLKVQYRKKIGNATRIICWTKDFPLLMKRLLRSDDVLHLTSNYKIIPPEVMLSKRSVIANFLSALFDCDATVRKYNPTFEYTTKNEKLADQVQLALLRFGVVSRKKMKLKYATNTKLKKKNAYFYITVEGKEKLSLLYESIPTRSKLKMDRLKQHVIKEIKTGSNIDVLPQEVNRLVSESTKILGIEYKPLRKKYSLFAAYNENRCCPTRRGLILTVDIFNKRLERIKAIKRTLRLDQKQLIDALRELKIYRHAASKNIGLSKGLISNHWARGSKARKANLEKLYDYVKLQIQEKIEKGEESIRILENLASSDIFWDRIEKIEKVEGEEWVYDLTVPNCHNFIGNGIFVHNSNIVDAVMFVLGTSSARYMRAAKLQNLIFNGGKDRKPADTCEVSLYIRNEDRKLGDEDEIKITRKVSRSGISIYKINGKTVTRSKILDLLTNANLSSEGYNIILQGDVTRIIEMSALERRGVIDEISGIAEFDEKKEKAQRELDRVEHRVRENMIVVAEKQRYVARLRTEREIAERYVELSKKLKLHKASLHSVREGDLNEKLDAIEKELKQETAVLKEKEKEFLKVEKVMNEKEKKLQELSEQVINRSRNYEITRKIDALHTEIVRKRDRIELNERELLLRANPAVREVLKLGYPDVYGTVQSLIDVPGKYAVALEVAMGGHRNDIVVETEDTAISCIRYLKQKRTGRARFLPLDRIRSRKRKKCDHKIIGYAIDLIKFDEKFSPAMQYILGSTVVVETIDEAKKIKGFRVVTLDGDIIEKSGVMVGGYYARREQEKNFSVENAQLNEEIRKAEKELERLKGLETKESEDVVKLQATRVNEEKLVADTRKRWKELFEERQILQSGIGRKSIEKARVEAALDNLKVEAEDFKDVPESELVKASPEELQEKVRSFLIEINRLGPVNMRAIEEYGIVNVEFEELRKKLDKLLEEKDAITNIVQEVEKKRYDKFMTTLNEIADNFSKIYTDLTGGVGNVRLEEENNIASGLIIEASPAGKRVLSLDAMSGGEKTLTSLGFLFAVMQHYQVPFYVLDEIDAALDKANTKKIVDLIKKYADKIQFIVISHNDFMIQEADKVFGVSMEGGVSKIFGIEMPAE